LLPVFAPSCDIKRDYTFLWSIAPNFSYTAWKENLKSLDIVNESISGTSKLLTGANAIYVSQLAKKIQLPDDELTTSSVDLGPINFPYATGWSTSPIVVTYLEDSYNTVYNFHRSVQQMARSGRCLAIQPLKSISLTGLYIATTSNSPASELLNSANSAITTALEFLNIGDSLGLSEIPTQVVSYPSLFPQKITRTSPDKSGTSFATTTVSYIRIPTLNDCTDWDTILSET